MNVVKTTKRGRKNTKEGEKLDDLLVENVPKKPVGSQRTKWTDGEFDTLLDQAIIHKVLQIALYFVRNSSYLFCSIGNNYGTLQCSCIER